jgi:Metallo-beta-lactamase superfamily
MNEPIRVTEDIYALPAHVTIPGVGVLPVNAFLILGEEPVLVDTGVAVESEGFLAALRSLVEPERLKWIWVTHDDTDHTGNLQEVVRLAPQAKLLTHAFAALRMGAHWPIPLDRVYALTPGERIDVGNRELTVTKPLLFDNPMSLGLFDQRSRTLFSVDTYGAILPRESRNAADFSPEELRQGITMWEGFDSPWVQLLDPQKFAELLEEVRQLAPERILSSHLPPAENMTGSLLEIVAALPAAEPFVPPNQAAFAQIAAAIMASIAQSKPEG